jgi:hypothetical protein
MQQNFINTNIAHSNSSDWCDLSRSYEANLLKYK